MDPPPKFQQSAMAKDGPSTSRQVPVGGKGRRFVAGAKTFLALATLALSFSGNSGSLARASQKQVKDKVQSYRHVDKACRQGKFNLKNLGDCVHLRQRLGLQVSFIEDPLVEGMVMGMAAKGLNSKIRRAVQEEAVEQAKKLNSEAKREAEARTLIGPRGGLPSLRSDLLRLAALLHVPIEESDTVDKLKEKVKPMIATLKEKSPPLTAVKSAAKKGARPKSSPKEPSATSMSSEHRPLSALQEEMRKMATQMEKLQKPDRRIVTIRRSWT